MCIIYCSVEQEIEMESYQKFEKHIEMETEAMCQIGFTKKEIAETLQLPLTVVSELIWRLNHETRI